MRFPLALAVASLSLLAWVSTASASTGIRYGIQDDAWLLHGPGELDARLDTLESLGADLVRFNLRWDTVEAVKGKHDWTGPDTVLEGLHERGIPAVVAIVGTPRWANGGRGPNYAPASARLVRAPSRAPRRRATASSATG